MLQIYHISILSLILFFSNYSMDNSRVSLCKRIPLANEEERLAFINAKRINRPMPVNKLHPEDMLVAEKMSESSSTYDQEIFEWDCKIMSAQLDLEQNAQSGTHLHITLEQLLELPVEDISGWKKEMIKANAKLHTLNSDSLNLLDLLAKSLEIDDTQMASITSCSVRAAFLKNIEMLNSAYVRHTIQIKEVLEDAEKKVVISALATKDAIQSQLNRISSADPLNRLFKITEFAYSADKIVPAQKTFLEKLSQARQLLGMPRLVKKSQHLYCPDEREALLDFCKIKSLDLQKQVLQSFKQHTTTKGARAPHKLATLTGYFKEINRHSEFFKGKNTFIILPFRQALEKFRKNLQDKIDELTLINETKATNRKQKHSDSQHTPDAKIQPQMGDSTDNKE